MNRLSTSDEQQTRKLKVTGHWTWEKGAWFARVIIPLYRFIGSKLGEGDPVRVSVLAAEGKSSHVKSFSS